jgi:uncharacterized protein (TIGR04255 family)
MTEPLHEFSQEELDEVFPRPSLREVAFEFRFATRLRVNAELWKIQDQLAEQYPSVGTEQILQPNGTFTNVNVFQNQSSGRVIKVSQENFVIAFTRYSKFEDFKDEVIAKANAFCSTFQVTTLKRIGLRYVNDIFLPPSESPTSLLKFVRPYMDFQRLPLDKLNQFVNEVQLQYADHLVTVRGVLLAALEDGRRVYVLDIDCYSAVPQVSDDIPHLLDKYHDASQRLFLDHITEAHKNLMRGK